MTVNGGLDFSLPLDKRKTMNWEDLSEMARDVMDDLGGLRPTVHVDHRTVKGWGYADYPFEIYYSSDDLRKISAACNEVADWLDKRADGSKTA